MIICVKLGQWNITGDIVNQLFKGFGEVASVVVSMQFAYVQMPNRKAGCKAITVLNGSELNGHLIAVKEALRPLSNRVHLSNELGLIRTF